MSDEDPPAAPAPLADADGDGLPNATEAAIDASARYQARVALVTAIVALVSALLGPLVSLKINSDQIDVQSRNNKEQIEAQLKTSADEHQATADQAESEFVRTERREAYTAFLTAYNNAAIDVIGAAGTFSAANASPKALAQQEQKAVDAVKSVTSTYYEVRIVASKDAFDEAEAAYVEFSTYSGNLLTAGAKIAQGQPLTDEERQVVLGGTEEYQKLLQLSIAFIEKGRADMSADD
jgi:hypothetical protein